MKMFKVTFYRHLIDRSGDPYRSTLETLRIVGTDRLQAFRKAVRRFEHDWSLYEWANLADACEVVEDGRGSPPFPA